MSNNENIRTEKELYDIKSDILRYTTNKWGFTFPILAIILDVAMFLIIYTEKNCVPDFQLGIDLLVNVIFLLAAFLLAEKMKVYNKKSAYLAFVVAAIQVLRILWIPLNYLLLGGLLAGQFIACCVLLVASGLCLVAGGIITINKSNRLEKHLKEQKE